MAMLIKAYSARFLLLALQSASANLNQMEPNLKEAALMHNALVRNEQKCRSLSEMFVFRIDCSWSLPNCGTKLSA